MGTNENKYISLGRLEELAKNCLSDGNYDELKEVWLNAKSCDTFIGSPSDYHNLAVSFAQLQDTKIACEILELGLKSYPLSVDLLADFLYYGIESGEQESCHRCFETLCSIPKGNWTWRAFDFAIEYQFSLLNLSNNTEQVFAILENLIADFHKYMPHEERSYLAESRLKRNTDEEILILEKAIKELKACPKCALKYADLMCERGEYEKALDSITKCINSIQPQSGINEGYAYYLSAVCKTSLILKDCDYENKSRIDSAYIDFKLAERENLGLPSTYLRSIKKYTDILHVKSGIRYSNEED